MLAILSVARTRCTVLGARPFQCDSRYHGCRAEGRARNDCEWTRGWLDPPHVVVRSTLYLTFGVNVKHSRMGSVR